MRIIIRYIVLFVFGIDALNVFGTGVVNPFTASGVLISESFVPGKTNIIFKLDAKISFSYSNGWWDIESTYESGFSPLGPVIPGTIRNCKRIPDGVRLFTIFPSTAEMAKASTRGLTAVTARPIAFPPPDDFELFVPWLGLCPKPSLPITNLNIITSLMSSSENKGRYGIEYATPNKIFLSSLSITNNGIMFQRDGSVIPMPQSDDHAFCEFAYKLLQTTNFHGVTFPKQSVLYRFSPSAIGTSNINVSLLSLTRLEVNVIRSGYRISPVPNKMIALDTRPPGLQGNVTVNYLVTNDKWHSLSNHNMQVLATIFKRESPEPQWEKKYPRRILILFILGAITLLPIIYILRSRKTHNIRK